jgi:hypothetical protein
MSEQELKDLNKLLEKLESEVRNQGFSQRSELYEVISSCCSDLLETIDLNL